MSATVITTEEVVAADRVDLVEADRVDLVEAAAIQCQIMIGIVEVEVVEEVVEDLLGANQEEWTVIIDLEELSQIEKTVLFEAEEIHQSLLLTPPRLEIVLNFCLNLLWMRKKRRIDNNITKMIQVCGQIKISSFISFVNFFFFLSFFRFRFPIC
jgi:hypothetical protein